MMSHASSRNIPLAKCEAMSRRISIRKLARESKSNLWHRHLSLSISETGLVIGILLDKKNRWARDIDGARRLGAGEVTALALSLSPARPSSRCTSLFQIEPSLMSREKP